MARPSKDRVTTDGGNNDWLPVSLKFLRSRACAELSPHALKMLIDLCAQLARNGGRNGDLSMPKSLMELRGWASETTARAALVELEALGLVVVSRRGDRRRCTLYAVTLWPLACERKKIDIGTGAYSTTDWRGEDGSRLDPPTPGRPAQWSTLRPRPTARPRDQCDRGGGKAGDMQQQGRYSTRKAPAYAASGDAKAALS